MPPNTIDKAGRLFQLALEGGTYKADGSDPRNFVLGRKSEYTQASCLYVACRMDQTNHMLIDFADAIGVNVFVLGRSYLRLIRCLGFRLPVIDPSIYISRFASLLDFGDETQRVATDATRLVQRFKKDWITHGRRPAGICGACLMIAARMNNFRRSIAEIIQVVKIADVTLRKRLDEFKLTSSSKLTIDDFRNIWLEEENEPPAFYLARMPKKPKKGLKGDRSAKRIKKDNGDEEESDGNEADDEEREEASTEIDPRLEALADEATRAEIEEYLDDDAAKAAILAQPVAKRSSTEQAEGENPLEGLDEEELDSFLLGPEEVRIKERVWIEFNKDYLERTLERQLKLEADIKAGLNPKPIRRKRQKPRDSSTAPSTAAESTKQMMRKRNFSKRLNYDVINSLFEGGDSTSAGASIPRHKRSLSDAEDEEEDVIDEGSADSEAEGVPQSRPFFISDAETTDADVIEEEDGSALPSNHPDVRKRSKEDQRHRQQRNKRTSRVSGKAALTDGDESGTDRATSRGMTDAETDNESNWRAGLPNYVGKSGAEDDDLYEGDGDGVLD